MRFFYISLIILTQCTTNHIVEIKEKVKYNEHDVEHASFLLGTWLGDTTTNNKLQITDFYISTMGGRHKSIKVFYPRIEAAAGRSLISAIIDSGISNDEKRAFLSKFYEIFYGGFGEKYGLPLLFNLLFLNKNINGITLCEKAFLDLKGPLFDFYIDHFQELEKVIIADGLNKIDRIKTKINRILQVRDMYALEGEQKLLMEKAKELFGMYGFPIIRKEKTFYYLKVVLGFSDRVILDFFLNHYLLVPFSTNFSGSDEDIRDKLEFIATLLILLKKYNVDFFKKYNIVNQITFNYMKSEVIFCFNDVIRVDNEIDYEIEEILGKEMGTWSRVKILPEKSSKEKIELRMKYKEIESESLCLFGVLIDPPWRFVSRSLRLWECRFNLYGIEDKNSFASISYEAFKNENIELSKLLFQNSKSQFNTKLIEKREVFLNEYDCIINMNPFEEALLKHSSFEWLEFLNGHVTALPNDDQRRLKALICCLTHQPESFLYFTNLDSSINHPRIRDFLYCGSKFLRNKGLLKILMEIYPNIQSREIKDEDYNALSTLVINHGIYCVDKRICFGDLESFIANEFIERIEVDGSSVSIFYNIEGEKSKVGICHCPFEKKLCEAIDKEEVWVGWKEMINLYYISKSKKAILKPGPYLGRAFAFTDIYRYELDDTIDFSFLEILAEIDPKILEYRVWSCGFNMMEITIWRWLIGWEQNEINVKIISENISKLNLDEVEKSRLKSFISLAQEFQMQDNKIFDLFSLPFYAKATMEGYLHSAKMLKKYDEHFFPENFTFSSGPFCMVLERDCLNYLKYGKSSAKDWEVLTDCIIFAAENSYVSNGLKIMINNLENKGEGEIIFEYLGEDGSLVKVEKYFDDEEEEDIIRIINGMEA